RARDRVVLLARLHALRRQYYLLVHERRAGDVQLGATDHDAVALTVDDADVGVGIVLLRRSLLAVALGVGDRLAAADVLLLAPLEELIDPLAVLGLQLAELRGDLDERHARSGRAGGDVAVAERVHADVHVLA